MDGIHTWIEWDERELKGVPNTNTDWWDQHSIQSHRGSDFLSMECCMGIWRQWWDTIWLDGIRTYKGKYHMVVRKGKSWGGVEERKYAREKLEVADGLGKRKGGCIDSQGREMEKGWGEYWEEVEGKKSQKCRERGQWEDRMRENIIKDGPICDAALQDTNGWAGHPPCCP